MTAPKIRFYGPCSRRHILLLAVITLVFLLIAVYRSETLIEPTKNDVEVVVETVYTIEAPLESLVSVDPITKNLTMKDVYTGCPPPKLGLIGISTTTHINSTLRRNLLRKTYRKINSKASIEDQFDIIFVFGNAKSWEQELELALEEMTYGDVHITEMEENMNLGKSLDWFLHARSILYTRHPTTKNHYCLRYKFIGKSDDDTVIHLPRLSTFLKTLHPQKSHYIGRSFNDAYMSGMFYLLTPDLTEWIHHSPIPKQNRKGHEDRQVGVWFLRGNITWGIHLAKTFTFHDLEEAPNIFARKSTRESVAIHWCKDGPKMFRCIADLYGTPEVAVKRLTSPGSLERHRELVSRVFSEFDSQRRVNLTFSTDFNIDTQRTQQLIKPLVENMMPKFIRDPFTEADLNQVVEHLAARFPMFKNDTERSIWRALAAKNISSTTVAWENYVAVRLENAVKDANGQPLSWNQLYEIRKPWLNAWVG